MKTINNYWVDENNNSWDCNYYTEEQAETLSKTLIDCKNCVNCISCSSCSSCSFCRDCRDCSDCSDCRDCRDCINCRSCSDCSDCISCISCSYCSYCRSCSNCRACRDCRSCINCISCSSCRSCSSCINCRSCSDCSDCSSCISCRDCSYCHDFKDNPQKYTHFAIGSRNDKPIIYWLENNIQCVVGCFRGNIDELEQKVKAIYPSGKHHYDYMEFIKICRMLVEISKNKGV